MIQKKQTEICQLPNAKWLRMFRRRLLSWYETHAREFPWRGTVDPYKVWVSEIMLQQTTTTAVEGYYSRFLERFPTVQTLADASDAEVLRCWEGLGYYRRATQLHRASRVIVSEHDGTFPNMFDAIIALPGIGRYTAGAICSIAYHQRTPILEANTIRLYTRILAYFDDPAKSVGNKLLWEMAELVLPTNSPSGQINQALMDLGSLVCTPNTPDCTHCPVVALCRSVKMGVQNFIPNLKKGKDIEERTEVALVIEKNGKYLMMRYPQGVRWARLWDFPRHQLYYDVQEQGLTDYCDRIKCLTGYPVVLQEQLAEFRHVVTHFHITLKVFRAKVTGRKNKATYQTDWVTARNLKGMPLNSTGREIAEIINTNNTRSSK